MIYPDLIAFQATRNPHGTAVVAPFGPVSFERFSGDIARMASALMRELLQPRRRVAIVLNDDYVHWLAIVALARLGHISSSFALTDAAELERLLPDLVLFDTEGAAFGHLNALHISKEWVRETLGRSPVDPIPSSPTETELTRIVLSSGTTGRPKHVGLTHKLVISRARNSAFSQTLGPVTPASRVLTLMGSASMGGYLAPITAWGAGASVLLGPTNWALRELLTTSTHGPASLLVAPGQLARVLETLPGGRIPSAQLYVTVGGSSVPEELSRATGASLTPNLIVAYGSTEAGVIANAFAQRPEMQAGATGVVLPWVEIQVVDAEGESVPTGSVGHLKIRSPDMIENYLDADGAGSAFRNGWFFPGDLGSLSPAGILTVGGRVSEVMNLGGMKLSPDTVEARVRKCSGVKDVAAFTMPTEAGLDELWLALVGDPGLNPDGVREACRTEFKLRRVSLMSVRTVPRNEMGKIKRDELRRLALAAERPERQTSSKGAGGASR